MTKKRAKDSEEESTSKNNLIYSLNKKHLVHERISTFFKAGFNLIFVINLVFFKK